VYCVSSAAYRCLYFFAGTPEERGGGEGSEFWEGSNNRSANSRKQKHEAHTFYEGSRNCARARGRGEKRQKYNKEGESVMSALIHTPDEKSAAGAYWVQTPANSAPFLPARRPVSTRSPLSLTAREAKNLITKKFWHSVSLVLVAIYRPEFRLALSISIFRSVFILRFLISPFHPFTPPRSLSVSLSLSLSFSRGRQPRYGRARICGLFEPASNHTHIPATRGPSPPPCVPVGRPHFL